VKSPFVAQRLALGDHVCWAFDRDDDRLDGTASLVDDGLRAREKVLCLTATVDPGDLRRSLEARGVPVTLATEAGQLGVEHVAEVYLVGSELEPDATVDLLGRLVALATGEGWAGLRVISDMAWALRREPDTERLVVYETNVNRLLLDGRVLLVCMYDRRLFDDRDLHGVRCAHTTSAVAQGKDGWSAPLRVRRTSDPPGAEVVGEADLSNRGAMAAMLRTLVDDLRECVPQTDGPPIVIDLSRLTFADTAAAGQLIRAGMLAPAGARLVGCRPHIARLLALLGAEQVPSLTVEPADERDLNGAPT
jgi:anti-anti-sigma regulatory factor